MKTRKAFNFYSSYDEVIQDLNDKQLVLFMRALLDVQFLRTHIDKITFDDKLLSICWKAIKHSVYKQIEGYCNSNKISYSSLFNEVLDAYEAPCLGALEAHMKPASLQEQEKEQEKEQGQEEFTFSLKAPKLLSSTSKEYKDKLKEYIDSKGKQMTYKDFYDQCEMKPYKYKNYKIAYDKWTRNEVAKPNQANNNIGGYSLC